MQTNNKLREALAGLLDVMHNMGIDEDTVAIAVESKHCHMHSEEHLDAIKKAKAALAEPVKNCEVGTAEEQFSRHDKYCNNQPDCKLCNSPAAANNCIRCYLAWSQMPYEKEGGAK